MDQWLKSAMANDTVVVELLLRLKSSKQVSLSTTWGAKQQRSTTSRSDAFARNNKTNNDDVTRFSPTTPLSWSGSASPSAATAHGCEEFRSKGTASGEGNSTSTKNCKRKKTFAELNQEETSLLKEGIYLRQIGNKKVAFQGRASNESLKKKLDLPNSSAESTLSDQPKSTSRVARTILIPDLNMMPSEEDDDSYAEIALMC
ncbi:PREDICTED: uncharacterized protein LOC109358145 isoform X2 [Lupinus angustifolius]|uniref:uncharacterized protein LOC109358145 isoform X2 n=1 Tax=Lupinus angustifolius TaxID=3871 RepID=UPI00092FD0A6|nr:PREDICTED: uncharacterized protein LOC109358145 isoform X2 [Lupinus angustifolius]